jgi:hypothetical protein
VAPLDAVLTDLVADASAAVADLYAAQAAGRHLLAGARSLSQDISTL